MKPRFFRLFSPWKKNKEPGIIRLIQNETIDNSLFSESKADKLYVLNSLGNKRVLESALTLLKMFRQHYHLSYDQVSINGKNYWEIVKFA